ncbi:IS200/IS605 family transposase [Acetohalobium arabaticum]|uniref:Transposase IS200-family protein n=1 Tax=Acetohalobium arabaticum (strain ATCC 49924 / DSM 5501 / Z-7288) TaxID=574087 RepID=D9QSK8_ACEAZ|nr:IS200/IS605 family transposase [Acetohalobium arabaticum]ADL13471.1 transposase IS200-family protein [Acetohalobium arabaticum DSM 5501]
MNNLIHARTCVYNVGYHIVFTVKYRQKVLTGKVATRLKEVLHQVAQDKEFIIETMELMPDHVHIFVSTKPTVAPTDIVRTIKSISAIKLFDKHPKLKKFYARCGSLWSKGYFIDTVGNANIETIKEYIVNQDFQ